MGALRLAVLGRRRGAGAVRPGGPVPLCVIAVSGCCRRAGSVSPLRRKSEIPNPKSETNPKPEMPGTETPGLGVWYLGFGALNLLRTWGFGFPRGEVAPPGARGRFFSPDCAKGLHAPPPRPPPRPPARRSRPRPRRPARGAGGGVAGVVRPVALGASAFPAV